MQIFDYRKKRRFSSVAFDPTGRLLAAGGDYEPTVVWDVQTGNHVAMSSAKTGIEPTQTVLFTATGRVLIPTSNGLIAFDPASGNEAPVYDKSRFVGCLALDLTGEWCVGCYSSSSIRLVALTAPGEPGQRELWSVGMGDAPNEYGMSDAAACLPGGSDFLSAEQIRKTSTGYSVPRRRIAIRSRDDGSLLAELNGALQYGDQVFASPASEVFVVLRGIWLRIHRLDDLQAEPRVVRNDGKKHFTAVAFHPSGKYLAATSNDTTVKLFDTRTWEVVRTFTWDIGRMRSMAFSADGMLAAAGGDTGKVVVWDVDL